MMCSTASAGVPLRRRASARTASTASDGSPGVVSALPTVSSPVSSFTRIRSVNVPPMSTPTRYLAISSSHLSAIPGRGSGVHGSLIGLEACNLVRSSSRHAHHGPPSDLGSLDRRQDLRHLLNGYLSGDSLLKPRRAQVVG